MNVYCLIGVLSLASFVALGQQFRIGAMAGAQMSSFINGNPMPGWKAGAVGSYQVGRFALTEQLGLIEDNTKSRLPFLPARNHWQYLWADATTIIGFAPIQREGFDLVIGSGISVRRIISHQLNGRPNNMGDVSERLYDWTYFLPARAGVNLHLSQGREIRFIAEYQYQLRALHEPWTITTSWDYKDYVYKLYSISLSAAYLFVAH